MKIAPYWKTVVAVIGAVVVVAKAVVTDDVVTAQETVEMVIAVLVALGVYSVPNKQKP